eukprot:jgi/Astpho2/6941/Aster-x0294
MWLCSLTGTLGTEEHELEDLAVRQDGNSIDVRLDAAPEGLRLTCCIPERYCSVRVRANGDIEVQTINEGALHLQSAGGAVKMGSIKASDISVATAGGPIEAGTLTASSVDLSSRGGSITVRKMMGLDVNVAAGTAGEHSERAAGDVSLHTVYTQKHLGVEAGHLSMGFLDTTDGAASLRAGADAEIKGLDGDASLHIQQGRAQVNLQEKLRRLRVAGKDASRVTITVPPSLRRIKTFLKTGSLTLQEGIVYEVRSGCTEGQGSGNKTLHHLD